MSALLPGNPNPHGLVESGGIAKSGSIGFLMVSISVPAVTNALTPLVRLLESGGSPILALRVTGGDNIQYFWYDDNGGIQSSFFTITPADGSRKNINIIWDETANGGVGEIYAYLDGSLVDTQSLASNGVQSAAGNVVMEVNSTNTDDEDITIYDLAWGDGVVPSSQDLTDYESGTRPGSWSIAGSISKYYDMDETGYVASLAASIGATTLDHTNITADETNEGSANALAYTGGAPGVNPGIVIPNIFNLIPATGISDAVYEVFSDSGRTTEIASGTDMGIAAGTGTIDDDDVGSPSDTVYWRIKWSQGDQDFVLEGSSTVTDLAA